MIALLGAQYAGAAIIPINTRYTGTEALDIVERVDAAALVVVGKFLKADRYQQLLDANPDLSIPTLIRVPVDGDDARAGVIEFEDFLALATDDTRTEADARATAVTPDDVSDILFTSGTTGRSKGAISAHRQSIGVA
ncbi:AMP-binding protein, partial [Micromonospora deserti]|uniref:AMP-binding protein n=1 Tax=Micromonospora deserti TaxID=2070366 RepID=UPI002D79E5E7